MLRAESESQPSFLKDKFLLFLAFVEKKLKENKQSKDEKMKNFDEHCNILHTI